MTAYSGVLYTHSLLEKLTVSPRRSHIWDGIRLKISVNVFRPMPHHDRHSRAR